MMSIRERGKRAATVVAFWWTGSVLLLVAGIAFAMAENVSAVLIVPGLLGILSAWIVPANRRETRDLMETLGVDEAAEAQYAQERRGGRARRFGKIVVTDHWVCDYAFFTPALLPLKDIVRLDKDYGHSRYHDSFWVNLRFKHGTHELKCTFESQEQLMDLLSRRCRAARNAYLPEESI